jgi:hypothetical protein
LVLGHYHIGGRKLQGKGTAWFDAKQTRADVEVNFVREGWELLFHVDESCQVEGDVGDSVRKSITGTFTEDGDLNVVVELVNSSVRRVVPSFSLGVTSTRWLLAILMGSSIFRLFLSTNLYFLEAHSCW